MPKEKLYTLITFTPKYKPNSDETTRIKNTKRLYQRLNRILTNSTNHPVEINTNGERLELKLKFDKEQDSTKVCNRYHPNTGALATYVRIPRNSDDTNNRVLQKIVKEYSKTQRYETELHYNIVKDTIKGLI